MVSQCKNRGCDRKLSQSIRKPVKQCCCYDDACEETAMKVGVRPEVASGSKKLIM